MSNIQEARVLILGKTGNGKSSFVNYLLDDNIAPTGIGKPITQDFIEYVKVDNKLKLIITDSKGLESNKDDFETIVKNIENYILNKNKGDDISKFFHIVFYCLKYSDKRVEPGEIVLIKKLKELLKFNIHFIITGCDSISNINDYNRYEDYIRKEVGGDIRLYKVCSIERIKRNGSKTIKIGKEEVIRGVVDLVFENLATAFSYSFANDYVVSYNSTLDIYKSKLNKTIDVNIGFWSRLFSFQSTTRAEMKMEFEKVRAEIIKEIEKLQDNIVKKYSEKLNEIYDFCNILSDSFGVKQALSNSLNTKALKAGLHFKEYGLWDSFKNMFTNNDAKESFEKYFNNLKIQEIQSHQNNKCLTKDLNKTPTNGIYTIPFLGNFFSNLTSGNNKKYAGEEKLAKSIKRVILISRNNN